MKHNFYIGQKVICIGTFIKEVEDIAVGVKYPEKGQIYTIRSLELAVGIVGITLAEIINPKRNYKDGFSEKIFIAIGFKPLQTKSEESESFAEETLHLIETEIKETYILK